jgi:serine/threonine-protein kinase
MSPQQATGQAVDHRSDLYSAGLIFYALLAGRPPFLEVDPIAMLSAQVKQTPPPLPAHVPAPLSKLVFELLAKQPEHRPADAGQVRARLEQMLPGLAAPRRRLAAPWLRVAIVGGFAAAFAITGAIVVGREDGDAAATRAADASTVATDGASDAPAHAPAEPPVPAAEQTVPASEPTSRGPDPSARPAPPPAAPEAGSAKKSTKTSSAKNKKKKKKKKGLFSGLRRDD